MCWKCDRQPALNTTNTRLHTTTEGKHMFLNTDIVQLSVGISVQEKAGSTEMQFSSGEMQPSLESSHVSPRSVETFALGVLRLGALQIPGSAVKPAENNQTGIGIVCLV